MDSFSDDKITRLLRLKRYEQPPPDYFENFLYEFRRRQRDKLRRQPLWSICIDCAHDFVFRHNVRPFAYCSAAVAAVVACAAVISTTIYQQPDILDSQSRTRPSRPGRQLRTENWTSRLRG